MKMTEADRLLSWLKNSGYKIRESPKKGGYGIEARFGNAVFKHVGKDREDTVETLVRMIRRANVLKKVRK